VVDRAYIFTYDNRRGIAVNTYEWCAPGISSQIASLQAVPLTLMPEAMDRHRQGKDQHIPDVASLPEGTLRQVLEPQGIKSLLTVPLMDDDACIGCVGFDAVRRPYAFSDSERTLLTLFARMLVNVNQHRQAVEELKTIYDHSPVLMCVLDEDRRVRFANPAFTAFTGVTEPELKDGRACGVFGCINAQDDPRGCGFGPACAECTLMAAIEDTLASGTTHQNIDYQTVLSRHGVQREVSLTGSTALIGDGTQKRILLSLTDVTEQKNTEKSLRDRERYLNAVVQTSQDGFWVLDAQGAVRDVNEAYCRMSGYTREELLRLSIPDLEAAESPEDTQARIRRISQGGSELFETRHRRKNGSLFDVEISATWVDLQPPYFVCFCRDSTERHRSENRIRTLLQEKELLLKETQHRVKNNLQTVHSLLTLQAHELADGAASDALRNAAGHVRSMMGLYDALYRAESTQGVSVKGFLPALIDEIIESFPDTKRIRTDITIDDFVLDAKYLSPIGMMVNELITNSMKYAFAGRERGTITFAARRIGTKVTLSYGDDGIGLPSGTDLEKSTGFGLHLIHLLTEQIKGRITVHQDRGITYLVEFEIQDSRAPN